MDIFITIIVTFFAGMGAGLGTGFAGMSAAAVISPMLISFLKMDPYMAVGIALSSDVLASAISAYTYGKIRILILKRTYNDGFRPCIYFYRKLHCKPSSVNHNGKFLGHHDLFPRCKIYPEACHGN